VLKSFGVSGTGSTSPLNLDFVRLASSRLGSLRSVLAHPRSPLSLQLRIIGVNSGLNVNSGLKTCSSSLPLLFSLHQHKTNQSLPQPGGSQAQLTLDIRSEVCCNSTASESTYSWFCGLSGHQTPLLGVLYILGVRIKIFLDLWGFAVNWRWSGPCCETIRVLEFCVPGSVNHQGQLLAFQSLCGSSPFSTTTIQLHTQHTNP
jgi:hypothetical protein